MLRRPDKIETACDNVIGQLKDSSGETISRGLAVRLIGGMQIEIAGKTYRSTCYSDLVRAFKSKADTSRKDEILSRFDSLAESAKAADVCKAESEAHKK